MVEQWTENPCVGSSILSLGTKFQGIGPACSIPFLIPEVKKDALTRHKRTIKKIYQTDMELLRLCI